MLFIYEQTGYVLVTVKSVMMSGSAFALSTICRKDMLGFPNPIIQLEAGIKRDYRMPNLTEGGSY